ncbi:MAG: PH domain-containing protein [Candidatus Magasanikbacteria bacterium]
MRKINAEELIDKNANEEIKYILHRHPITFLKFLFFFFILTLVPVALYLLLNNLFPEIIEMEKIYAFGVVAGGIYYLSILLFLYTKFVEFYLDVWIVTDQKIVDIVQAHLFSRNISELDLDRIQDVTTQVSGILPTIFDYGNVSVQTASQNAKIDFLSVHNPNEVRKEIIRLSDLNKRKNKHKQL